MSIWEQLRAHNNVVEQLRRCAERGRLAHGYAFFGPHGVGRRLTAQLVSQSLLCTATADTELDACGHCAQCKQVVAGNHPDVIRVSRPEGKREVPIDLIAGRPERRGREGLCYELSMRPMSGNRRIGIIDDAETLNAESSNSLLKTLEEPPAGSLMILIATGPEALLPTILSRVQPLFFSPLPDAVIVELLTATHEVGADEAMSVAQLSGGSLSTAGQLLDGDLRSLQTVAATEIRRQPFHSVRAAAAILKALDDLGGDAAAKRIYADWVLRFVARDLRSAMLSASAAAVGDVRIGEVSVNACGADEFVERVGAAIERVIVAERAVAQMMPVPLVIEGFCDDLATILRGAHDRVVFS